MQLNKMPVGTTLVRTKIGWTASLCTKVTAFNRVKCKGETMQEALQCLRDKLIADWELNGKWEGQPKP